MGRDERHAPTVLTVGHGTASREELVALLSGAGVELLVDIRRYPGSRRNPDVDREQMAHWLPSADIDYWWEPTLGGRRRVDPEADIDTWWRVEQFRAYAAHTRTAKFRHGLHAVLAESARRRAVLMCSESLWWRCHRRLVSDVLVLLHDASVQHLDHNGRLTTHVPADGARVTEEGLVYDAGQPPVTGSG